MVYIVTTVLIEVLMERRGAGSVLKAFTLNDGVTTGLGHYVHSVIMAFDATNLSTPRLSVCEQMLPLSYNVKLF